ncbi:MAG: SET domain-containing protein-lysine N-methyltransferase [Chitinophagales bacterium]|nr:SET domain-containing protein-lysine N-methyltransferase [Chitinophagales bacterium]
MPGKLLRMFNVYYELRVAKSGIQGKGAFAITDIPARKKIGDLGGVIISIREARKRVREKKEIAMVELTDKTALDASVASNSLRYINHSCSPNCYIRVTATRVEFYTLRFVKKGEELSADYGVTHHEGKLPCRCGAANCKGFI